MGLYKGFNLRDLRYWLDLCHVDARSRMLPSMKRFVQAQQQSSHCQLITIC